MLEDFRLRVFMAVVKEKSFTRAASALNISQPAVSQNIAELEKGLGTKLFERRRSEVLPTPAGRVFMDRAEKILGLYASAEDVFASVPSVKVRISISEELYSHLFAPALDSFMKIHPEIEFVRCIFDDADLRIFLRPSSLYAFVHPEDTIARLRMSMSACGREKTGSQMATRERTSYFDVVFQPSESFSCTKLCRLLKDFLIS